MQGYYPESGGHARSHRRRWLVPHRRHRVSGFGQLSVHHHRKKDLLKTSAGKFVAPQPIENALKTSPYISNAMVVGDQCKFVVALLVPNPVTEVE